MSDDWNDPDDAKGRGAWITWAVLGLILLAVLAVAHHLHAFPWQAAL